MRRLPKETPEDRVRRREAAYERGWVDGLQAYDARATQPVNDIYDYWAGWEACASYRWRDPSNNGVAVDPTFRPAITIVPPKGANR